MEEKRPKNWQWWLLAAGLGFVHFFVVLFIAIDFGPSMSWSGGRPRYQPGWFYYAFLNVFLFPWSMIYPWVPHGPKLPPAIEAFWSASITLTCFLWGVVWAEPFRWKFGWRPWRFTIREMLAVTAVVASLLGWLARLNGRR